MNGSPMRYWNLYPKGGGRAWNLDTKDDAWCWRIAPRLRQGKPMRRGEWPQDGPVFTYDKADYGFQDMPDCILDIYIVSTALREFLAERAPGALEFLPVRFEGPRASEVNGKYWAVNWVRTLDILDEEASCNVDEKGKRFVEVPVVDVTRAPEDGVLGILKGFTVERLVRDDLRRQLRKSGFTGLTFGRVYHSGEEDWVKPDHRAPAKSPSGKEPTRRKKKKVVRRKGRGTT